MALKYWRDYLESRSKERHDSPVPEPVPVCQIKKPPGGGPNYEFDREAPYKQWLWQWMVANLRADDMKLVVDGPNGEGGGIVSCYIQQTIQYDHKRHHAEKNGEANWGSGKDLKVWDFFLARTDGSVCWLHPSWSVKGEAAYAEMDAQALGAPPLAAPTTGPGGSDGRYTFAKYKTARIQRSLRFDKLKNQTAVAA